jgi:hypothetical protein
MNKTFLVAWSLIPIAVVAWHFGPGEKHMARDRAGGSLRAAQAAEAEERWSEAAALYAQAADELPDGDQAARNRLQVHQARCRIRGGEIIEGHEQLEKLLSRLSGESAAEKALVVDAFHELATASYYAAWIMRREGASSDEWKPEAECARQLFRFLAEEAGKAGSDDAETWQRDLEATIRLEQMDLSTLMSKPPPKKCCNCKNLSQRKRKQCQSRCQSKQPGEQKEKEKELRQVIHSAGLGTREGSGS